MNRICRWTLTLCFVFASIPALAGSFKDAQMRYPRVRDAAARNAALAAAFAERGLAWPPAEVFLRVFKHEGQLELWARGRQGQALELFKAYPVCAGSGVLGPKRKEGDLQVPEGFYTVSVFQPQSSYHLALGIDYPNRSDRILSDRQRPGGAIMIHGNCVTIGCIPLTDPGIEEVYLLAVEAHSAGQGSIPVHIFPTRLDEEGLGWLREQFPDASETLAFWQNLKPGFDSFEQHRRPPRIAVNRDGSYRLAD